MNRRAILFLSFVALTSLAALITELNGQESLATVAEKSNYTKTSTHAQVLEFCDKLFIPNGMGKRRRERRSQNHSGWCTGLSRSIAG